MARKKSQDYAKYVKWMWDQRDDVDRPFHVKSVTSEGSRKDTFPDEALSLHEAEGLFRFLESKNLVTVQDRSDGEAVYSLNVVEHYKWGEVISDLSKSDLRRSWFYLKARDWLFWAVTLVIAAFLGATGEPIFNIAAHKFHWIEEPTATASPVTGHEPHVSKQEDKPDDAKKK